MKIEITGEAKEIAVFALELQRPQPFNVPNKAKELVKSHAVHQVIESPIQAHSVKPDEARRRIVELLGDVPRIELFARQRAPGWDAWGDELK